MHTARNLALAIGIASLLAPSAQAGHEIDSKDSKCCPPAVREWFPDEPLGMVSVGGQFSENLNGVYLDSITALWAPKNRDAFLFLNSRYHYEDNGQFLNSTGLGFRKLLPDRNVILGVNAYWDSLHSAAGSDFNQFGFGAEVLTEWFDARFNYYLPEDSRVPISRRTTRDYSDSTVTDSAGNITRSSTERTRTYITREAALRGFNSEIGFLVPGISKYTEVRIYGGYYHYDNPFGSDFQGFKARLEAHLLPNVIADVEYWDDAALMGGHWTAGVRASVPFSFYNLVTGRNPFEGIKEGFTPRRREFKERMSDMVERSHRIQTTNPGSNVGPDSDNSRTESSYTPR